MPTEDPSSTSWARPGVRCVCMDARPGEHPDSHRTVPLLRGRVYVVITVNWHDFSAPAVQVDGNGISAALYAENGRWLRLSRFRPLVTRSQEQDAGFFSPLLRTTPEERLDLLAADLDALASAD